MIECKAYTTPKRHNASKIALICLDRVYAPNMMYNRLIIEAISAGFLLQKSRYLVVVETRCCIEHVLF